MSAYFVTGTGTGVGKTFVAAGLVRHLRAAGKPVWALKPVVSGFDMANLRASDPGVLLEAMGRAVSPEGIARISHWRFAAPLSPDMAGAREGREIDFDALVALCREEMSSRRGTLIIEGVGGVMAPLDARHTVLDWMAALQIPAILVAGSYLGTISHTLTALAAMAHAGVTAAALVVNDSGDGVVPIADTLATLGRFTPGIPIATIPRVAVPREADASFSELAALVFQGVCG
ncbi:MAG: dethiobiotin synthase [Alphaproteobacteria bacterium]|nr:dethiobiotin synthase [Alphaproteobacteria bacterium]